MDTCTWAPTVFQGTQVVHKRTASATPPDGFLPNITQLVQRYESLGINNLLVAQRWWGSGKDIEASSLDCLAMTTLFAGVTKQMRMITAIHPGFFLPTAIAKWATSMDNIAPGRWAINVTSGWNMQEFDMYGIAPLAHDERYERAKEFIEVLRGAWQYSPFTYEGKFYKTNELELEPRPKTNLVVFQGGQSEAAQNMAASHSDWMFLNGADLEDLSSTIDSAQAKARLNKRLLGFAMYAAPLCRPTDDEAWAEIESRLAKVDHQLLDQRIKRIRQGAQGMWAKGEDPLNALDTNEGFAARLIGSPETILKRLEAYAALGISMLHFDASDPLFNAEVLPHIGGLGA